MTSASGLAPHDRDLSCWRFPDCRCNTSAIRSALPREPQLVVGWRTRRAGGDVVVASNSLAHIGSLVPRLCRTSARCVYLDAAAEKDRPTVSAVGSLATLVAIGATAEPVAASSSEPARLVTSAPRPTPTLVVPSTTATTASTSPTPPPASTTPPPTRVATPSPTPGPAPKPLLKPAPKPAPKPQSQPKPQPKPEPKEQPEPQPKPQPKTTTKASDGGSVYYANCAAVIAAGKAPIRRGDPGYRAALDRDGDGQGCAGD
jgi:hypothetical protein